MNSNMVCVACKGVGQMQWTCSHSYCQKCLDKISLEGGAKCSVKECNTFLNVGDLMNRNFQKFQQHNLQIFGQPKLSQTQGVKQQVVKDRNNPQKTENKVSTQAFKGQGIKIGTDSPKPQQQTKPIVKQTQSPQVVQQQQQVAQIRPQQQKQQQNVQQTQQNLQKQVIQQQQIKTTENKVVNPNQQIPQQQIKATETKVVNPQLTQFDQPPNLLQQKINSQCSICKQEKVELYINIACNHKYCVNCSTQKQRPNNLCLVDNCEWQLMIEDLQLFITAYKFAHQTADDQEQVEEMPPAPVLGYVDSEIYGQQDDIMKSVTFKEIVLKDMTLKNINQFIAAFDGLRLNHKSFTDTQFLPNQRSLGDTYNYPWMRVAEIFQGDYSFFSKDHGNNRFGLGKYIAPNDIIQGALGNCYLLASISALGNRRPDLLLDNFITQTINEQGIYCVRLCINGIWQAIAVDDHFPINQNGYPAFTKSRNNAIWVMVLEKAWAKVSGSYKNTHAGSMQEVLRALTGAPTEIIWTAQPDFKNKLQQYLDLKTIMVAATQSEHVEQGLVPNHAYSILKIRVIQTRKGVVELVKLRNPWGNKEWTGDWSQNSPLWTPDLRKQFTLDEDDNGVFYMDISSFMQYFRDIHVCHIKMNYLYSAVETKKLKKHAAYHKINVTVSGEYFISVVQKNQRFPGNSFTIRMKSSLAGTSATTNEQMQYFMKEQSSFGQSYTNQVRMLKYIFSYLNPKILNSLNNSPLLQLNIRATFLKNQSKYGFDNDKSIEITLTSTIAKFYAQTFSNFGLLIMVINFVTRTPYIVSNFYGYFIATSPIAHAALLEVAKYIFSGSGSWMQICSLIKLKSSFYRRLVSFISSPMKDNEYYLTSVSESLSAT